jgi:hypothetical protein
LAKTLNISKARVSQYIAKGMPVLPDGKLDREQCVKWIQNNVLKVAKAGESGGARLLDVRVARELLHVQIAKLNLDERQRKLINAEDVQRTWAGHMTLCRNQLLHVPDAAGICPGCREIVQKEIRRALTELSGGSDGPA